MIPSRRSTANWFADSGSGDPASSLKYQLGTLGKFSLKYTAVFLYGSCLATDTTFIGSLYPTMLAIEQMGSTRSTTATRASAFSLPRHMAILAHRDEVPIPPFPLRNATKIPLFLRGVVSPTINLGISSNNRCMVWLDLARYSLQPPERSSFISLGFSRSLSATHGTLDVQIGRASCRE